MTQTATTEPVAFENALAAIAAAPAPDLLQEPGDRRQRSHLASMSLRGG